MTGADLVWILPLLGVLSIFALVFYVRRVKGLPQQEGDEVRVAEALASQGIPWLDADVNRREWVRVTGPVGSGKSTILRMIAAEFVGDRPVIALQLQRDNSRGFAATGAEEYFNEDAFIARVEREEGAVSPVLIIDGIGCESADRLSAWFSGLPEAATFYIVASSNREDIAMSLDWGDVPITIRLAEKTIPGVAIGTFQRGSSAQPTYWEVPLVSQPQIDR